MAQCGRSFARSTCTFAVLATLLAATACGDLAITADTTSSTDASATRFPDQPDPGPTTEPPPGETAPDPSRLDDLIVAAEVSRSGYGRERFKHWSDLDRDGCDTREEVLIEESLVVLALGPSCTLVGGSWFSPYDGKSTTNPSTFDVDHFVPLAEAWDSGANEWTDAKREQYANDLEHADALIAVTGSSNRSKSDRDPAEWMPPRQEFRCTYAATWIEIKLEWDLTVDEAEMTTLTRVLEGC